MKDADAEARPGRLHRLGLLGLILCLPLLAGCVAIAAGGAAAAGAATGVAYYEGDLQTNLGHPTADVNDAVLAAAEDLQLGLVRAKGDAFSGTFRYRDARGTNVRMSTKSLGSQTTRLRIRVGIFGNENLSLQILEAIRGRLPQRSPSQ